MQINEPMGYRSESMDYEQGVLGSMMIERAACVACIDMEVHADKFKQKKHKHIFNAIMKLAQKNDPVDILTVQEELRAMAVLEEVGGTSYLVELTDAVPAAANIRYYIDQL